jgi:hypothetical protein
LQAVHDANVVLGQHEGYKENLTVAKDFSTCTFASINILIKIDGGMGFNQILIFPDTYSIEDFSTRNAFNCDITKGLWSLLVNPTCCSM